MLDQSRVEVMRQDLLRAANTIQKLKKERDDFRESYEKLKESSISKKHILRNQSFVYSLKDTNEMLIEEIMNLRNQAELRDQRVVELEDQLISAKLAFKNQAKGLKDIETAQKELNREIQTTKFTEKPSLSTDLTSLTSNLLSSIKSNLSIHKIFKSTVNCNKHFLRLIQTENYCTAFKLLSTFLITLISSFQFGERNESCSSEHDWKNDKIYNKELREANEERSIKVLQKKLKQVFDEHRLNNESSETESNGKRKNGLISSGTAEYRELGVKGNVNGGRRPGLQVESNLAERSCGEKSNCTSKNTKQDKKQRSSISKSPVSQTSPRSRFEEFRVPFRKIHGSASVAECLGNKHK